MRARYLHEVGGKVETERELQAERSGCVTAVDFADETPLLEARQLAVQRAAGKAGDLHQVGRSQCAALFGEFCQYLQDSIGRGH